MVFDPEVRLGFIGCGRMARNHINGILQGFQNTSIEIVCEPSEDSYSETKKIFESNGRQVPLNIPDIQEFLNSYASELDAVMIVTPHVMHHDHAIACMNAGLDMLIEKPMVMNASEELD